jgi:glycosyltransferase involved in cell wall biosynthesis
MKTISIVIPTYNRAERLSDVLDCLLNSDLDGISAEIVVVDDGSTEPARHVVEEKAPPPDVFIKYLYQENRGPATARNNGFRNSSGEIVLFIDDDILVPSDLVKKHVNAHEQKPKSVIVGPCPCRMPEVSVPSARFIHMLETEYLSRLTGSFTLIDTVISGNLSIERGMFADQGGLYNDELRSPTAEEFDVIAKLKRRNIPVFLGRELGAVHLQPTSIDETCKREYKHAVGIGELRMKSAELFDELPALKDYADALSGPPSGSPASIKLKIKGMLSGETSRAMILGIVRLLERALPIDRFMFPLFKGVIGINILAGLREGKRKFDIA